MNSFLKAWLWLVVLATLIGYFSEVAYLFGLFFWVIVSAFDLFLCFGADVSVVKSASKVISFEIIFFLVYFLYSKFFK